MSDYHNEKVPNLENLRRRRLAKLENGGDEKASGAAASLEPGPSPPKRAKLDFQPPHCDVVDLCHDDGNDDDHNNNEGSSSKMATKSTCSGEQQQQQQQLSCPIKLFATTQDLEIRKQTRDSQHWSRSQCETLREMLGLDSCNSSTTGTSKSIDWLVISNYMVDFEFLLGQMPELFSISRVVVFYGIPETSPQFWKQAAGDALDLRVLDPSAPAKTADNPMDMSIPFGVHHSKFFLIGYSDHTLRVVIHTANLRHGDILLKTQGAYRQDFQLKTENSSSSSSSPFEDTLLDYLDTYKFQEARIWHSNGSDKNSKPTFLRHVLRRYDFTPARAILVPSTPGYHRLDDKEKRGHLKVKQCVAQHVRAADGPPRPIVCQFSSMGSLSGKYLKDEFQTSFGTGRPSSSLRLVLVYPTVDEIRTSVEGYRGGGSVPGTRKNINKPFLRPLYHCWTSAPSAARRQNPLYKGRNVPHIKTYYQLGQDDASMDYLVLSSHNLSKAAWGEIQNSSRYGGRRHFMRHWELGVFVSPSLLGCSRLVPWSPETSSTQAGDMAIPLPYSLKPTAYGIYDRAWTVDEEYETPDYFGRLSAME